MSNLHFCRDGILRRHLSVWDPVERSRDSRLVPLHAYEIAADSDVFLKSLHDHVTLEEGLTIGELFENLAPWAEIMTGIACMDFPAFLDEVRAEPEEVLSECSHILLSYHAEISPTPAFERPEGTPQAGIFRIGRRAYTGRINLEGGWSMSAVLDPAHRDAYDGADAISLGFSPLSEWRHLPVIISMDGEFEDLTPYSGNHTFLGTSLSLTREEHPNIEIRAGEKGKVFAHTIKIQAPAPTFFNTIVRGLLWEIGFHFSPVTRDSIRSSIEEQMGEIESWESGSDDVDRVDPADLREYQAEAARMQAVLEASAGLGLEVRNVISPTPKD